jgi:predicted RND superfamily exporter protein
MNTKQEKEGVVEILSRYFEAIGAWSYDHRWIVLGLCILTLGASVFFASKVRFDNSFEAFFDQKDPSYADFLQFRHDFESDEISYILYEAPGYKHGPWDIEVMRKIGKLTSALEDEVPFIYDVTSLANAELIEGVGDDLIVHDILDEFPETQEELLSIRDKVLRKPVYVGGLISKDGKSGAIIIDMEKNSIDPLDEIKLDPDKGNTLDNLYPQCTNKKIEDILARPEYSGIKFYHTGDVPLNTAYNLIAEDQSIKLFLISYSIIGLLLFLFFRKPIGAIGPLALALLSILIVSAFVGIMNWKFDLIFAILPSLLVAVGVADAVHIISEFLAFHAESEDRRKAIKKTLYLVAVPCLFTSITTMAGFMSMSVSPIISIKHFALYSAVGVVGAFVLSITLLTVFLSFGPRNPSSKLTQKDKVRAKGGQFFINTMQKLSDFDIKHKGLIIFISLIVFLVSLLGITKLKVDSNFLTEFSQEVEIRKTTEYVDSVMGGTASFSYVFETQKPGGIIEPAVLREIEALQKRAEQEHPLVMKTYSIVDLLKDINRTFHNENDEYYVLPDSRELVAQYLLIYESSGGEELHNYLTEDYQRANLELRCKMVETSKYEELREKLKIYIDSRKESFESPRLTGIWALWLKLSDYIVSSQLTGFALASVVITLMMCLVFGSFKIGLLSMIPNTAPIVVTLGFMGWRGIPLDYFKLLITCIAIGIAVDDTVHLITRYRHEFLRCKDYKKALFPSFVSVGRALFITTMVLVVGFLSYTFSIMDSMAHFGLLVASTIVVALLADFFLLPVLLILFKPFGPEGIAGDSPAT